MWVSLFHVNEDEDDDVNFDLLNKDDDDNAILPSIQAFLSGSSISRETQPSRMPCKAVLHEVCKRVATRLAIN